MIVHENEFLWDKLTDLRSVYRQFVGTKRIDDRYEEYTCVLVVLITKRNFNLYNLF